MLRKMKNENNKYLETMEVLKCFSPDVPELVVMETDGLQAVSQVDECLLVNPLEAGTRKVEPLEAPQRRELDGGETRNLVPGQDDRGQPLVAVKKFCRKF